MRALFYRVVTEIAFVFGLDAVAEWGMRNHRRVAKKDYYF